MDGEKQSNREHRPSKSGNKAEKKGTAKAKPEKGQNPKVSLTTHSYEMFDLLGDSTPTREDLTGLFFIFRKIKKLSGAGGDVATGV